MMQPMQPPRRMRYSIESRCKMVALMVEGVRPQATSAACSAIRATLYRLWRATSRVRARPWLISRRCRSGSRVGLAS